MKRNIIDSAMKYHKIVLLIVGFLILLGIYGLYKMPKQEFPTFTIRQGAVVAIYPGATSAEIEEQVTKPLESFIFGYKEVNKKKTYSISQDGMSIVFIDLNDNLVDKDAFWSKFKHGLESFKVQLPTGVISLQAKDNVGDTSAMLITLEGDQRTYRELDKYLENLEVRLRQIDEVSHLKRFGVQHEQIDVYLDQNKMSQYGIGSYSLLAQLFSQGFKTVSGTIINSHLNAPIHIKNTYNNEGDVAQQIVYSDPQGNVIRLKDIARIVREYPKNEPYIKYNGKRCVLLSIEKNEGANIVDMGKKVNKAINEFKETLPNDVHLSYITDQSKVVNDSVHNFLRELLIAVISVIIIVMLLMPLRVAYVSAVTIPITIFCALALFFIIGLELNTVVLAALIVTLGMVVDDSIVIIDNYMEKLGNGMPRIDAATTSAKEFFKSVLSATLAISITFFPFLFTMHGMQKDFVLSFPWAISIILSISLIVALTVTPYLQYSFIHKGIDKTQTKKRKNILDYLQSGYNKLLSVCFKYPTITLLIGIGVIVTGGFLFLKLPRRLMPIAERDQFAVEIYLPKGSTMNETTAVADSMERILRKDSQVVSVTSFIGSGSPRFHATYAPQIGGDNFAQFIVNTKGDQETEKLLDKYADKYVDYFPNARIRFKQMDYSDALYPIEFRLSGDSISSLLAAADTVMSYMRANPSLKSVRTNYEDDLHGVDIIPNETEINRLGINKTIISTCMALHFGNGIPISTLWEGDNPIKVVLKSDSKGETTFDDIPNEYIPVNGGTTSVPLRQIATVKPDWTTVNVIHRNGIRTLSVIADPLRGHNATQITNEVYALLKHAKIPNGVTLSIGGIEEKDTDIIPMVTKGLVISIFIIFFILLCHFKKISLAILNLTAISLCIFGAAIGMNICSLEVSLTSVLGLVSLMGILVRNGIIMLDYAEKLRLNERMSIRDAAYHAGTRRMRPIFLTSAAASIGVLPMVMEHNALWSPMGTIIFFGTLISMILISTILPVAYWFLFSRNK
jgi:multidrug efflux pump